MKYIQIIDKNGTVVLGLILMTYIFNIVHILSQHVGKPFPDDPSTVILFNVVNLVCPFVAIFFLFEMMNTGWNIEAKRVDAHATITGD